MLTNQLALVANNSAKNAAKVDDDWIFVEGIIIYFKLHSSHSEFVRTPKRNSAKIRFNKKRWIIIRHGWNKQIEVQNITALLFESCLFVKRYDIVSIRLTWIIFVHHWFGRSGVLILFSADYYLWYVKVFFTCLFIYIFLSLLVFFHICQLAFFFHWLQIAPQVVLHQFLWQTSK